MLKTQMFIGAALLVGVAVGYFAGDHGHPAALPEETGAAVPRRQIADKGEAASVKALRARIAELEKALAEKSKTSESAVSNAVAEAVRTAEQNRRPGDPREWLENIRKTDPERYVQMTNRFAQWRKSRAEQARSKMDFLSSIDISHMSASARQTHDELQQLIVRREEIEQALHQEGVTDEHRHELMEEMRASHEAMNELNRKERHNLIAETARELGFKGEDAKEFTATIKEIIRATDNGWGGHRGGPGRGPGGGRGR